MHIKFAILLHRLVRQNKSDIESEIFANCFDCKCFKTKSWKTFTNHRNFGHNLFLLCFMVWSEVLLYVSYARKSISAQFTLGNSIILDISPGVCKKNHLFHKPFDFLLNILIYRYFLFIIGDSSTFQKLSHFYENSICDSLNLFILLNKSCLQTPFRKKSFFF